MSIFRGALAAGGLFCVITTALAQGYTPVHVVKELPDWQCMALASAYGSKGTDAPAVPVYASPGADARQVGTGAGVIIVPKEPNPTNGRTEMIWPNGKTVWIDLLQLVKWHSLSDPKAVCHPAFLSNGRYGFVTSN
jgi:hypothetical protein